jgi:hypothetical protein
MLSTPVCGVDSKNEIVEPLLAPCLYSDIDTGITPQEHKGNGTPKIEALTNCQILVPPKWRSTISCETSIDSKPATKNPNKR